MYINKLPNLELLNYQAQLIFCSDKDLKASFIEKKYANNKKSLNILNILNFDCQVFSQMWSSTATAFPGCGGSAMTTAYTVVFYEPVTNKYIIFIDDKFAYMIYEPNSMFLNDLDKKSLVSISMAYEDYGKIATDVSR